MENYRDMPRWRLPFLLAAALIAAGGTAAAADNYLVGGSNRIQRLYQAVLARYAAAGLPLQIVETPTFYTLATNLVEGKMIVTQSVVAAAATTNSWRGPGYVTQQWLAALDQRILDITPHYADQAVTNISDDGSAVYDAWFAREAWDAPISVYAVIADVAPAICPMEPDWRHLYIAYDAGGGTYSGHLGYHRVRTDLGAPPPPVSDTQPANYCIRRTPADYPRLTPAAVGLRTGVGATRAIQTSVFGDHVTGGEFSWTRDWRSDYGASTSPWLLWEVAAAKAPFIFYGNFALFYDAQPLIPFYVDPYREQEVADLVGATNAYYSASAAAMRAWLDPGPAYITYPLRALWGTDDEMFAVIGRKRYGGMSWWVQMEHRYLDPPDHTNISDPFWGIPYSPLILARYIGTNAIPPEYHTELTLSEMIASYRPAPLGATNVPAYLKPAYSETGDQIFYVDPTIPTPIGLATNETWYWRQHRGSRLPPRYLTNTVPRYVTSGTSSVPDPPPVAGYILAEPAAFSPATGQILDYAIETPTASSSPADSAHRWLDVVRSPAWLHPPTGSACSNGVSLRLEYAPAPTLHTEPLGSSDVGFSRLHDLAIEEREKYLDYLQFAILPADFFVWTNTVVWSNAVESIFPAAATNRGSYLQDTTAARWAASQAKAAELATWSDQVRSASIGGLSGLPSDTFGAATNAANYSAVTNAFSPTTRLILDIDMDYGLSWSTTWYSDDYDPAGIALSNLVATPPQIGSAGIIYAETESTQKWDYEDAATNMHGNTYLAITTTKGAAFQWGWDGRGGWHDGSRAEHVFDIYLSVGGITNAIDLTDLDAEPIERQYYASSHYTIDNAQWIQEPFRSRPDAFSGIVTYPPDCFIRPISNSIPASSGYDINVPSIEDSAIQTPFFEVRAYSKADDLTTWYPEADVRAQVNNYEPVFTFPSYEIGYRQPHINELTLATNAQYRTTTARANDFIINLSRVTYYPPDTYVTWGQTAVTNSILQIAERPNYAAFYSQIYDVISAEIALPVTNYYWAWPASSATLSWPSHTNIVSGHAYPIGSSTEGGVNGAVGIESRDISRLISARLGYEAITNVVDVVIFDGGGIDPWAYVSSTYETGGDVVYGAVVSYTYSTNVLAWDGDWLYWHRYGLARRENYGLFWTGPGPSSTNITASASLGASIDDLPPVIQYRFYPLQ